MKTTTRTSYPKPMSDIAGQMRRFRVLVVVALFALALSVNVASAAPDISQVCDEHGDFWYSSHGQCVSIIENLYYGGNTTSLGICKDTGNFNGYFQNQGECISTLRRDGFV